MKFFLKRLMILIATYTFCIQPVAAQEQATKICNNATMDTMPMSGSNLENIQKISKKAMPVKNGKLEQSDIQNLCRFITGDKKTQALINYFDYLIKKLGVTKEEFNTKTIHTVFCAGSYFIQMASKWFLDGFMAIADYGVDLSIPIIYTDGEVTTFKDFIAYQYKHCDKDLKPKFGRIYKYLRDHNIKGCKERPELKCTNLY